MRIAKSQLMMAKFPTQIIASIISACLMADPAWTIGLAPSFSNEGFLQQIQNPALWQTQALQTADQAALQFLLHPNYSGKMPKALKACGNYKAIWGLSLLLGIGQILHGQQPSTKIDHSVNQTTSLTVTAPLTTAQIDISHQRAREELRARGFSRQQADVIIAEEHLVGVHIRPGISEQAVELLHHNTYPRTFAALYHKSIIGRRLLWASFVLILLLIGWSYVMLRYGLRGVGNDLCISVLAGLLATALYHLVGPLGSYDPGNQFIFVEKNVTSMAARGVIAHETVHWAAKDSLNEQIAWAGSHLRQLETGQNPSALEWDLTGGSYLALRAWALRALTGDPESAWELIRLVDSKVPLNQAEKIVLLHHAKSNLRMKGDVKLEQSA